jgi:hypothetical protein
VASNMDRNITEHPQCRKTKIDLYLKNHAKNLNKNYITCKPPGRGKRSFASPITPRPPLGPTQPSIQWLLQFLPRGDVVGVSC